MSGLSKAL